MLNNRYCFTLDLVDDAHSMAQYRKYHRKIWPEITKSITDAGIIALEIYLSGNRLFMIMETEENFTFERKAKMDAENPKVVEWENTMAAFQKPVAWAKKGEKWTLMERIFDLEDNGSNTHDRN